MFCNKHINDSRKPPTLLWPRQGSYSECVHGSGRNQGEEYKKMPNNFHSTLETIKHNNFPPLEEPRYFSITQYHHHLFKVCCALVLICHLLICSILEKLDCVNNITQHMHMFLIKVLLLITMNICHNFFPKNVFF